MFVAHIPHLGTCVDTNFRCTNFN